MFKAFVAACVLQAAIISSALAAGPYGNIKVGGWIGGAFTDDRTGAFSHCAATTAYASGFILVIGQNSANSWLLGFANPKFGLTTGQSISIDVTFDGQTVARIFANANSKTMMTAILPPNVARTLQRST